MNNIDFEQRYGDAITEVLSTAPNSRSNIPTLIELMDDILQGEACEQQPSPTFEAFFDWWDVYSAYTQMDEGFSAADHKPILRVAYDALKASGRI